MFVQEAEGLSTSDSKRKGNKRGTVCLGGEEKELLQWALNSFLPSGPEGFKPKPGNVYVWCVCVLKHFMFHHERLD